MQVDNLQIRKDTVLEFFKDRRLTPDNKSKIAGILGVSLTTIRHICNELNNHKLKDPNYNKFQAQVKTALNDGLDIRSVARKYTVTVQELREFIEKCGLGYDEPQLPESSRIMLSLVSNK